MNSPGTERRDLLQVAGGVLLPRVVPLRVRPPAAHTFKGSPAAKGAAISIGHGVKNFFPINVESTPQHYRLQAAQSVRGYDLLFHRLET